MSYCYHCCRQPVSTLGEVSRAVVVSLFNFLDICSPFYNKLLGICSNVFLKLTTCFWFLGICSTFLLQCGFGTVLGICSTFYNKHSGIGDKGPLIPDERSVPGNRRVQEAVELSSEQIALTYRNFTISWNSLLSGQEDRTHVSEFHRLQYWNFHSTRVRALVAEPKDGRR